MDFIKGEIIAIDKPYRMSSFGALAHCRWVLTQHMGQKVKVGHDEGHHASHDEHHDVVGRGPRCADGVIADKEFQEVESSGCCHGGHSEEEGELGGPATGELLRHATDDGGHAAARAGNHREALYHTNMPSGLIVVNEDLEVQQINRSALALLNISHESDILGDCVVRILDTAPFFTALETGKSVKKLRSYFSDYGRYFEQTIVYDRSSRILIDIFSDVTEEEEEAARSKAISRQTAEITNNVIENQMRIVQEIASLLGETTAETKIALTRLKESLSLNDDEE